MIGDFRVYTYRDATLTKVNNPPIKHKNKNMSDVIKDVYELKQKYPKRELQYVIVEYTGPYQSKIVKII